MQNKFACFYAKNHGTLIGNSMKRSGVTQFGRFHSGGKGAYHVRMDMYSFSSIGIQHMHKKINFPPLSQVTTNTIPTGQAAFYLNRRPQTLRTWACFDNGPTRPLRINGRLAWHVKEIRLLVGCTESESQ